MVVNIRKAMTDALQIALSYGLPGCLLIAGAIFQAWRLLGAVRDLARLVGRYIAPVWRPLYLAKVAGVALILWAVSGPLAAWLEELETRYITPVYVGQKIQDEHALSMYEAQIRKHCDEYETRVVMERTQQIADSINSTPIAIYEAALLECGLNPFRVRDDKVAAGWIQFTRAGLHGLGGSMPEVIAACGRRDIRFIMDLTERYLVRKWAKAGRPDMRNTIDLYLAVFAPAHIGAKGSKVVYAGVGNPAYDLNSGLDGWRVEDGKIVRGRKDGRIEVLEIFYCIERKKRLLLKK
jgi:hypothetical protein